MATTYNITNHSVLDQLHGLEVSIYEKIKRFMDFNTLKAEVSLRRLAEECQLSKNTVLKYINKIVDKGLLFKKVEWDHKENQYKTNQYYFVGELKYPQVVQGKKDLVQDVVQYKKSSLNEVIDIKQIKLDLVEKYGQDIVDRALQQMKISTDRGTNIVHMKPYLNKVCSNLKAQLEMAKGISQVSSDKSSKGHSGQKKNHPNNLKGGWGSSSISSESRSSNYTNDQLEEKMLEKRLKYSL